MDEDKEYGELIKERFKLLPKVVQQAIISADVDKQLRELANTHKLHLDQWQDLQDQVMLTLLAVNHSEDLEKHIESEVGVPHETAVALAADISKIVFEPIRAELERSLADAPPAAAPETAVEEVGAQAVAEEKAATVAPATPPQEPNTQKVARAPISENYKAGESSSTRSSVHDDPYREPPA